MERITLDKLEFDKILQQLAQRAYSESGRQLAWNWGQSMACPQSSAVWMRPRRPWNCCILVNQPFSIPSDRLRVI